jgi:hypothetical protein
MYFKHSWLSFREDESGQAILEYIVILSACMLGAVALGKQIMNIINKGILRLGAQLEKDLKTGRMPLGTWSN